jgi:hypothetical protein
MSYRWPAVSPQPGVVERRLQVRRHAVDEVAVGALQHLLSGSLKNNENELGSARTCLDGPERRLVEPPEQRLHPLVPPELLAGPERRRLVRRRGAGPDTTEEEEEQEKTRNEDGGAGRSSHLPVPWGPEWMVHWLPLLAAALGGSRRIRIHWPRRGRAAIAWECGASAPTNLGFARAARSEVNSLYQQQ